MAVCPPASNAFGYQNALRHATPAVACTNGATATRNVWLAQRATTYLRSQADGVNAQLPSSESAAKFTGRHGISGPVVGMDNGQTIPDVTPANTAAWSHFLQEQGKRRPGKDAHQPSTVAASFAPDAAAAAPSSRPNAEMPNQANQETGGSRAPARRPLFATSDGGGSRVGDGGSGQAPTAAASSSGTQGSSRVQQIRAALLRKMRAQVSTPSPDNINLLYEPAGARQPANAAAATPPTPDADALRADPQATKQLAAAVAKAAAAVEAASRGRRKGQEPTARDFDALHGSGGRQQQQEQVQQRRLLKPRSEAERAAAEAVQRREEAAAAKRRMGLQRANEEFAAYLESIAAAVAAGKAPRRSSAAAAADEERLLQEKQRSWREQRLAREKEQRKLQEQQEWEQRQRRLEEERREAQEREAARREEASLLRGLAGMFRNFARQAQLPAAAAAAAAAAITPSVAARAIERATSSSAPGNRDRTSSKTSKIGFLNLPSASDVRLVLRPLGKSAAASSLGDDDEDDDDEDDEVGGEADFEAEHDEKEKEEGDVEGEGLRARPLPTRADLLRLLKPVGFTAIPSVTRLSMQPLARRRKFRKVRLSLASAKAAGVVGPAGERPVWQSPAEIRAMRRRAYFYRVLAARQQQEHQQQEHQQRKASAGAAGGVVAAGGQAGSGEEMEEEEEKEEIGEEEAVVKVQQEQQQELRPRYALSGASFNVRKKFQYSDRVKKAVRRAALVRGAAASSGSPTAVAATAATAAAAATTAAAATGADGARAQGAKAQKAEVEDNSDASIAEDEGEEDGADGAAPGEYSRGEYNPAAEVVNDVYQDITGVRLPERAMYGRRAETLAALTPQRVKEQLREWVAACGREYTLAFHAKEPLLLAQSPHTLLLSLEYMSRAFRGLSPEQCVALALRSPVLIGLSYEQLNGAVEAVSEALEVGMQEAGKIVMRCPQLAVREAVSPIAQRVVLLGALLPVSRDKLRQVLRQRPLLLTKSVQNLAGFMMGSSAALGLPLFDVALMIAGSPNVMGVNAARLSARWAALRAATAAHPPWRQQLAAIAPPTLGRCLVASEAAIGRLQVVVSRGAAHSPEFASFKRVLTMPAPRFEASLAAAAAAAAATATAAAAAGDPASYKRLPGRQDGGGGGGGAAAGTDTGAGSSTAVASAASVVTGAAEADAHAGGEAV